MRKKIDVSEFVVEGECSSFLKKLKPSSKQTEVTLVSSALLGQADPWNSVLGAVNGVSGDVGECWQWQRVPKAESTSLTAGKQRCGSEVV